MQTIRLWVEFVINRNTVITSISQLTRILKCRQKQHINKKHHPSTHLLLPLPHQIIWDYRKTYIDGKSPSKAFTLFTLMKFLLKGISLTIKISDFSPTYTDKLKQDVKKTNTKYIFYYFLSHFFFYKSNKWHITTYSFNAFQIFFSYLHLSIGCFFFKYTMRLIFMHVNFTLDIIGTYFVYLT